MPFGETICAAATPPGESALAIIRVSGPLCRSLCAECLGRPDPAPRSALLAGYRDRSGRVVDRLIATFFAGPASHTGEDVLELCCHGSPLIVRLLLDDLLARGCRGADPGEFTRTAFLNGKLDLSQAEAVMEVIHARSERALATAQRQLDGALGRHVQGLAATLLDVVAHLEAYIDFPEEDLPPEDIEGPVRSLAAFQSRLDNLMATSRFHTLLHEGVRTVIVGEPNAGKSSLLNALAGEERALVSEEPGTTRDYIESRVMAGPYQLLLTDTAGLRETDARLERMGIARSLEQAARADLLLVVADATRPAPDLPSDLLSRADPAHTLVIINKCDIGDPAALDALLPQCGRIAVSALTGMGIDALRHAIVGRIEKGIDIPTEDGLLVSARHARALAEAKDAVARSLAKLRASEPVELAAADLREALDAIGRITGRIDNEQMLDRLFAKFCIGK